jgi:hypothetical protein
MRSGRALSGMGLSDSLSLDHHTTQTPRRPNGAGGVRGASRLGRLRVREHHSCSVSDGSRVQNGVVTHLRISSRMTLPIRLDAQDAVRFPAKDRLLKSWPELQILYAARTRSVSAAGLRLLQAKLSRNSNHSGRTDSRFES